MRACFSFQLPLSGSRRPPEGVKCLFDWDSFNSLSRDHRQAGEHGSLPRRRLLPFNSLSRDHAAAKADAYNAAIITLSTPSLGITIDRGPQKPHAIAKLSTPSLGITLNLARFNCRAEDFQLPLSGSHTCGHPGILDQQLQAFNSLSRDHAKV